MLLISFHTFGSRSSSFYLFSEAKKNSSSSSVESWELGGHGPSLHGQPSVVVAGGLLLFQPVESWELTSRGRP